MSAMLTVAACLAYYSGSGHEHEGRVTAACDTCATRLKHTLNSTWTGCVMEQLLEEQAAAQRVQSSEYFPTAPHILDPFGPDSQASRSWKSSERITTSELLKNLLRNYSCDFADGGSQPVRSMTWEYKPADPCANAEADPVPFAYKKGFLPAGNDLKSEWSVKAQRWLPRRSVGDAPAGASMTVSEAQQACLQHKSCSGFTYASPAADELGSTQHVMHFKTSADGSSPADGWHTFKRKRTDCRPGHRRPPPVAEHYTVDVLREEPPVYVVRDFVSSSECEHMTGITIPKMERSVVFGGGQSGQASSYRQSYSVNMYPDYEDEANVVTQVVRRKFAFAREVREPPLLRDAEGERERERDCTE